MSNGRPAPAEIAGQDHTYLLSQARGQSLLEDPTIARPEAAGVTINLPGVVESPLGPVHPTSLQETEPQIPTRKSIRAILFAAANTMAQFAQKYRYLRHAGYPRGQALRKARWHIR